MNSNLTSGIYNKAKKAEAALQRRFLEKTLRKYAAHPQIPTPKLDLSEVTLQLH